MIRDGIYYCVGAWVAAALVAYFASWGWGVPLLVLGLFALYFFRNPAREIPAAPDAVVSPADGRVTHVENLPADSPLGREFAHRISIFLSIFDVHVTRAPAAGRVVAAEYRRGRFHSALSPAAAAENEQNLVRLAAGAQGETQLAFAQIAGLIARRIVFWPRPGEQVARGQLVGLIKFGSRVEVFLPAEAVIAVTVGQRVRGGATLLAHLASADPLPTAADADARTHC
ncbi:MAG: phosphatidylserine decarboxylase [Terriglobales bacterium]